MSRKSVITYLVTKRRLLWASLLSLCENKTEKKRLHDFLGILLA